MDHVVIVKWIAKDGEEEAVAAALARMIGPSRAEPGNIAYEVHRDPEDRRVFVLYERYADEAALQAHRESEHFRRYAVGDALDRLAAREPKVYLPLEGEGE